MNIPTNLEELRLVLSALTFRVQRIESDLRNAGRSDEQMAWQAAAQHGLHLVRDRGRLIRVLLKYGWSVPRIARALGCCERTVCRIKRKAAK
jgi:DNA-binding NarL/FixJ family response regulator